VDNGGKEKSTRFSNLVILIVKKAALTHSKREGERAHEMVWMDNASLAAIRKRLSPKEPGGVRSR